MSGGVAIAVQSGVGVWEPMVRVVIVALVAVSEVVAIDVAVATPSDGFVIVGDVKIKPANVDFQSDEPAPVPASTLFATGVVAPVPTFDSRALTASFVFECINEWLGLFSLLVAAGFGNVTPSSIEVGKFALMICSILMVS